MKDLTSPRIIKLKGLLFLVIGIMSAALLLIDAWSWHRAALLAACVWGFSRFYYFAFYVIQNYVDPSFRFAGLLHFARYLLRRK